MSDFWLNFQLLIFNFQTMKGLEFPIVSTKVPGLKKKFDLTSPKGRKDYFEAKVGDEIGHLRNFLDKNTFVAYLLGKKNSGKGTYAKLFTEIFGEDKVEHVSVGDIVRDVHTNWKSFAKSDDYKRLRQLYRGYISYEAAIKTLLGRSTKTLLPTEFVLALLKIHIEKLEGKSIFLDGLPRESDQVSYSLYFRDIINYRGDPDMFVIIDIPEAVINERIKYRVVCPKCQTSRNKKLLITSKIEYDTKSGEFYLVCDNPKCPGARMEAKEGDDTGIEPIRDRLQKDDEIMRNVFSLHGVPKILLRNHVPKVEAREYFDEYELTPEYSFIYDEEKKKVKVLEKPWTMKDDNGVDSNSLLAPPVVVSMIKQLFDVLNL